MKQPSHPIYLAISSLLPLIGIPGNILLMVFSLRRWRSYHLTSNEFLVALLTIFNVIKICLFCVICYAAYYEGSWNFGELICKIVSKSGAVAYLMTGFIIVFLVNIHYKVITRNQFYVSLSGKFAMLCCLSALVVSSGAMGIPNFYEWNIVSYNSTTNNTRIDVCEVKMEIWLVSILCLIFLPAFYCIVVIFLVKRNMKTSLETLRGNMKSNYFKKRTNENRRVFTILAVMSFSFTVSHVPLMTLHLIEYLTVISLDVKLEHLYSWYTFTLFFISASDTCATPIAYIIFNPSLRRFLRKIVTCKSRPQVIKRRKAVKLRDKPNAPSSSSTFILQNSLTVVSPPSS